jgi:hypothetical protein
MDRFEPVLRNNLCNGNPSDFSAAYPSLKPTTGSRSEINIKMEKEG